MSDLKTLEAAYHKAEKAMKEARAKFDAAFIEAQPLRVGDVIKVVRHGCTEIRIVTRLNIRKGWRGYELDGSTYPVKKNGEASTVGEWPVSLLGKYTKVGGGL